MLSVLKNSTYSSACVDLQSINMADRKLFLFGTIDDSTANDFLQAFLYYEQEKDLPLYIYINSCGGSVQSGLTIIDIIKNTCIKDVYLIATSTAASMGALILSSGAKGKRFALPNCQIMVHQPLIGGSGLTGSADDIESYSKKLTETKVKLNKILAENTGKKLSEIEAATSFDNFMSADEAKDFGIIDEITTSLIV